MTKTVAVEMQKYIRRQFGGQYSARLAVATSGPPEDKYLLTIYWRGRPRPIRTIASREDLGQIP